MAPSKDAFYFSHDSNAKDDPKCVLLIEQLGLEGYGIFWVLVETLRDQPDYRYPLSLLPALARRYNTTAEKMKTVVHSYGLFSVSEDDFFFSDSLDRRMEGLEKAREQRRLAGKRSAEKRLTLNDRSTTVEHPLNDRSTTVEHPLNDRSTSKVKESKVKESKKDIELSDDSSSSPAETLATQQCPYQEILGLYNDLCKSFPRVRSLSEARKKAIAARWKQYGKETEPFRQLFRKAEASSFLKGGNKRNWTAKFDWLVCDSNMAKVLDGNYDDHKGGGGFDGYI